MTTSGRPAYGNLAGHPFGVNAKWLQTNKHISGWHTFNFSTWGTLINTRWHRWRSGQRWHQFWCMCTHVFLAAACLRILCYTILGKKAALRLILLNHCRVCFYHSLHIFMPRKLNPALLHESDFGARLLDTLLHSLDCGARKPSIGHSVHWTGKVHVGLFQLNRTSLPCHSSRHVENLQGISCF